MILAFVSMRTRLVVVCLRPLLLGLYTSTDHMLHSGAPVRSWHSEAEQSKC